MKWKIYLLVFLAFVTPLMAQMPFRPDEAYNLQVQTSATGANWVQLGAQGGKRVTISTVANDGVTTTAIEVRRGSTATFGFVVPANASKTFRAINNAQDLYIRRADQSNTQITLTYEVEGGGI